MKIKSENPFQEFSCYKIFHKKAGRFQVSLKNKATGKMTTILYSKFLMSKKLGRILSKDEEVDHIDGNKTNDSIENLEVVSRTENHSRWRKSQPGKRMVSLECPQCGLLFERERRQTHLTKGGSHTFCSRKCSGKFRRS